MINAKFIDNMMATPTSDVSIRESVAASAVHDELSSLLEAHPMFQTPPTGIVHPTEAKLDTDATSEILGMP